MKHFLIENGTHLFDNNKLDTYTSIINIRTEDNTAYGDDFLVHSIVLCSTNLASMLADVSGSLSSNYPVVNFSSVNVKHAIHLALLRRN